jgi:ADP-dependent phosphofructokinase/glucokinase
VYAPVVLGLGGTVDYEIVWSSTTLERLAATYGIRGDELTAPTAITSERDLVRSILSFVMTGAGGERFVTSSEIIETLAACFDTRITLGGTCVRAALALDKLGVPSTVHLVSIDDHVRRLLPDSVSYMSSADRDSTDPHLIVQFPEGAHIRIGDIETRAPQSNRLIYVHDPANREMRLSDELPAALSSADYFLISGLNSMQDPGTLDTRLSQLTSHLRSLQREALVVYEDAGFHVPELSRQVRERLADIVDVYSMNEDELQGHLGRAVDLLDAESVAGALRELRTAVPARTLVLHTAHWSLALGDRAETYRAGLWGGVAAAGARYVHGDGFTEADFLAVRDCPEHAAGAAIAHSLEALMPGLVCCVPGPALRADAPTTIGLGDTFVGGFLAALVRDRSTTPP